VYDAVDVVVSIFKAGRSAIVVGLVVAWYEEAAVSVVDLSEGVGNALVGVGGGIVVVL